MALSTGSYVPAISTQSLNLVSIDGTKMRSVTYDDTFNLESQLISQAANVIPLLQGAFPPDVNYLPCVGGTTYTLVLGFNANLGTSTTIAPSTGTDGTISSYVVRNNYISLTYTTHATSPEQTLNITSYSADNSQHNSQTFVSFVYSVVVSSVNLLNSVSTVTATFNTRYKQERFLLCEMLNGTVASVSSSTYDYTFLWTQPLQRHQFSVPGGYLTSTILTCAASGKIPAPASVNTCAISGDGSTYALSTWGSNSIYVYFNNVLQTTLATTYNWGLSLSNNGNILVSGSSKNGFASVFARTGTTWTAMTNNRLGKQRSSSRLLQWVLHRSWF